MDRENSMRAIGLVLLSIAIMALLLTDADAKRRRSSAQGSQAAGASGSWCATYPDQGLNDNCSYSSLNQCLLQMRDASDALASASIFLGTIGLPSKLSREACAGSQSKTARRH